MQRKRKSQKTKPATGGEGILSCVNNGDSYSARCIPDIMNPLLIVDDDVELCQLVTEYLKREGFAADSVHEGEMGVQQALSGEYALVVLDVMLPGIGGFEALRRIRSASRIPILMLTARGEEVDRVMGLEIGADDYLAKPFSSRELVARIRAILRRAQEVAHPPLPTPSHQSTTSRHENLCVGDIELDVKAREVRRSGISIEVTTAEFDLLAMLLRAAGEVVTREDIAKIALGRELLPYDRSIDVHISNLRKKLGAHPQGAERIKAIRSIGYIYTLLHESTP